jgi:hypothetical protein
MSFGHNDFKEGDHVVVYAHTHTWEGTIFEVLTDKHRLVLESRVHGKHTMLYEITYNEIIAVGRKKNSFQEEG